MVSTDISQIVRECNSWREQLRSSREEITRLSHQLQSVSDGLYDKEMLTEVEHYHNQFYIQQINIHDLKQAIKLHERKVEAESADAFGKISEDTAQQHETLLQQYHELENTLHQLKDEFLDFVAKVAH